MHHLIAAANFERKTSKEDKEIIMLPCDLMRLKNTSGGRNLFLKLKEYIFLLPNDDT